MAKPRTPEHHGPQNEEVRFERSDIDPGVILGYGVIFVIVIALSMVFILYFAPVVLRWMEPAKRTSLPPVAGTTEPAEEGPRLEAIEDLERKAPKLLPSRAYDIYSGQRDLLLKGGKEVIPIDQAMKAVVQQLPAGKQPPPSGFRLVTPSGASAGRTLPGGP